MGAAILEFLLDLVTDCLLPGGPRSRLTVLTVGAMWLLVLALLSSGFWRLVLR